MFKKVNFEAASYWIIVISLLVISFICLYPFLHVLSMSISDPVSALRSNVTFYPRGFSLQAYEIVFQNQSILLSFYNTVWYTAIGTLINIVLTMLTSFPLSRKDFFARKFVVIFIIITMFFSGGMIPSFILITKLHIYNTRWAIILPAAVSAINIIIAKTFIQAIPYELQESAKIEGCNDFKIFCKVIMPLSKTVISVLTLFVAVSFWNNYFSALLYLTDPKLHPIQMYLMKILISNTGDAMGQTQGLSRVMYWEHVKHAAIIVVIIPIILVYPFTQKYFTKGIMLGSLKE